MDMQKFYPLIIGGLLNTHSDFCLGGREPRQHATRGVPLCCLTCIHAIVPLTCQPRNCKDGFISIVMRPLISLRYAICSIGRWSIIGRCVGACQRSSCAEERLVVLIKKTSHLIFYMSMRKAVYLGVLTSFH